MHPFRSRLRVGVAAPAVLLFTAVAASIVPPQTPARGWSAVTAALEGLVEQERTDKQLPAISIALVDGAAIVWSKGYGLSDPGSKTPADGQTLYRAGSLTKLFVDVAIMQLVEKGALDLDAPVASVLPEFQPRNPFRKPVTLRELMTHRAGLVREPPIGHFADTSSPSLAAVVGSLARTELVYPPGSHTKFSDAGIAVEERLLEKMDGQPFAASVWKRVLQPIGTARSGFEPAGRSIAKGFLWTYDGRTFEAPGFPLGIAAAGDLAVSADDLARFLSVLFAGGRGPGGPVLSRATLEKMWTPQFAPSGARSGGGIGFRLGQLDGRRVVAQGGTAYGFATELAGLPDERLGVAVAASLDGTNAVTGRIAREALRLMLAARSGERLPAVTKTSPLAPEYPPRLAGRYGTGERAVDLIAKGGELFAQFVVGGYRVRMRRLGNGLISDDRLAFGDEIDPLGNRVRIAGQELPRVRLGRPAPPPERWKGLIGEYGPDFATLYVLEKDGKLHALVDWFEYDPLVAVSENAFRFPGFGLYDHEMLTFTRSANGRASAARLGAVRLDRRSVGPEEGKPFQIRPVRPVEELRREALAASPPKETGDFRPPELVELTRLDPRIRLDVRYAKRNNFLGTPLYTEERAFLQKPAAEALVRAEKRLRKLGYGLLVHDAYRPWYVTRMFWDATPEKDHIFVANPATGSRHNRGCAVDLTLYDLATGRPAEMPGTYDEMSPRSYPDYPGGTSLQRGLRDLLRWAMEAEGFTVYEYEWWHYDYKDWSKYPIMNVRFEEMNAKGSS